MAKRTVYVRQPDVAAFFPALLAHVAAGTPLKVACGLVEGGPNENAVRRYVNLHPAAAQRLRAARMSAGGTTRWSNIPRATWDAALAALAASDSTRLTTTTFAGLHIDQLRRRAQRDAAFAERLEAALAQWRARHGPTRHGADAYRRAIDLLLANGDKNLVELSGMLVAQRLPPLGSIYSARFRHPWIAAEYAKVTQARGVRRYDDAAHAEARRVLLADPLNARRRLAEAPHLPGYGAVISRALWGDEESAQAMQERRQMVQVVRLARRKEHARDRASRQRALLPSVQLRTALLAHELYALADRAVSRALPPDVRDDMVSEIVVAVLDGELAREEIATEGRRFARRAHRHRNYGDTLDRPAFRDANVALVETITADRWYAL